MVLLASTGKRRWPRNGVCVDAAFGSSVFFDGRTQELLPAQHFARFMPPALLTTCRRPRMFRQQ